MYQLVLLILLSAWAVIQNLIYLSYLPERVATHFGGDGQPNDWMSRGSAVGLMIFIQILLPWFLVGIAYALRAIPASLVNIPHREYWLHADRREPTLAYIRSMITSIALFESVLMSVLNHLTFTANRTGEPLNNTVFLTVLGLFSVATLWVVISMLRRFQIPKGAAA